MTDRETLIEEAAKAIREVGWHQYAYRERARAALSVFEKHSQPQGEPSDAAVEAAALVIAQAYGWETAGIHDRDTARAALRAALAVFEKAHTPTDDEREALVLEKIRLAGHLAAEVMVFQGDTYPVKAIPYTSFLHILDGFRRSEPQGEPSDAQVRAAAVAWIGAGEPDEPTLWSARAALRAAWDAK